MANIMITTLHEDKMKLAGDMNFLEFFEGRTARIARKILVRPVETSAGRRVQSTIRNGFGRELE